LRRRREFLAVAASGFKWVRPGVVIQFLPDSQRGDDSHPDSDSIKAQTSPSGLLRFGLTATKRIGNAVVRNRARRRLRAIAQVLLPQAPMPSGDYVLIAREGIAARTHDELCEDVRTCLRHLARLVNERDQPPKNKAGKSE
jgi:ribonuclease P protein component